MSISETAKKINEALANAPPKRISVHPDILTREKTEAEKEKEKKPQPTRSNQ